MAKKATNGAVGDDAQAAQPSIDDLMTQVKAVAESRKWKGHSKSNLEKAKKCDELAAQSMSDA